MPAAQQIISSMKVISGEDGTDRGSRKIVQLKSNANFLRKKLKAAGCAVLGSEDSPVVPIMIFQPAKISAISRECFKHGVAIVVVGFPYASPAGEGEAFVFLRPTQRRTSSTLATCLQRPARSAT